MPGIRHTHWPVLGDPDSIQAQTYAVEVEPGAKLVKGPFEAETVPVSVEQDYVVITV